MQQTTFTCRYNNITIEGIVCYGSKRRKRISLCVTSKGVPELRLPLRISLETAKPFIQSKAAWLLRHMERIAAQQKDTNSLPLLPATFQTGEHHLFKGQAYPLDIHVQTGAIQGVCFENETLIVRSNAQNPARIHTLLKRFYQQEAKTYFNASLQKLMESIPWLTTETLPTIRLKSLRKRWGSCTSRGIITLNTHLIKVPSSCADFVLLHELAHIQELNHSQDFYTLLNSLMPDWRTQKAKLEKYDLSSLYAI